MGRGDEDTEQKRKGLVHVSDLPGAVTTTREHSIGTESKQPNQEKIRTYLHQALFSPLNYLYLKATH